MDVAKSFGNWLESVLPTDSKLLYRFCKRMVDRHDGDNNADMVRNGELPLMREVLPSAAVVFDVGAHVGEWTSRALAINPKAAYHCFEPSTDSYEVLVKTGFPGNVTLNHCGLGNAEGLVPLFLYRDRSGENSLYDRSGVGAVAYGQETVRIETLDGYCERNGIHRIDFAKLDVEGHELSVLKGGRSLLRQGGIRVIQFEYGGTYIDARVFLKDVWDYVGAVNPNYAFYKIYPAGLRLVPTYEQTLETFQYSNWVATNDDSLRRLTLPR